MRQQQQKVSAPLLCQTIQLMFCTYNDAIENIIDFAKTVRETALDTSVSSNSNCPRIFYMHSQQHINKSSMCFSSSSEGQSSVYSGSCVVKYSFLLHDNNYSKHWNKRYTYGSVIFISGQNKCNSKGQIHYLNNYYNYYATFWHTQNIFKIFSSETCCFVYGTKWID